MLAVLVSVEWYLMVLMCFQCLVTLVIFRVLVSPGVLEAGLGQSARTWL